MTNEHDGQPQRWFAGGHQANRSRSEAIEARASTQAQSAPGRSTLTESLDLAPFDAARVFDEQLEIAGHQLAVLEAANHAGDHRESALAGSGFRTALRTAEKAVARTRVDGQDRAVALDRRLTGVREAARPVLEQAFTPSAAAIREAVAGDRRVQWDLEVAAWRAARGRVDRAGAAVGAVGSRVDPLPASVLRVQPSGGGPVRCFEQAHQLGADRHPANPLPPHTPVGAMHHAAVAGGGPPPAPPQVGHANTKQKAPGPKADDAKKEVETALGAWAGAGVSGRIFQNDTAETFIDAATGDTVEVRTDWMLAEFESFELKTNTLMAIEREIHIRLARGVALAIKSRARAWFHSDRLPNDMHAALHAPARLIRHQGTILVTDEKGAHLLESFPHPVVKEQSVAGLLDNEPMLGIETDGPQRLREAEQFSAVTVPQHDANLKMIGAILRDAADTTIALRRYIKAKLDYESPSTEPISSGRHMIHRIEALTSGTWTGYEGTAVLFQLKALWAGYTKLVAAAENAKPAEKGAWDHAADAARAIGAAIVGVGVAIKELVLMARDLGLWLADEVVNLFGSDLDWSAASSIGKGYQSGKSTSEIFIAVVGGIVDAWDKAIEHASNGDYSKLMNLGAELALDVAIGVATAGAATPALAAERAGTGGRWAGRALALTESAAEALGTRTRTTLAKLKRAIDAAPATARKAALELQDALQGMVDGLATARHLVDAATGTRMAVLDPGAIPRAIQRLRGARDLERATAAVAKLRGPARSQGQKVITKLQKLADNPKMADAAHTMWRRLAHDEGKGKLVAALDRFLEVWPARPDFVVFARVMRRAGAAADPARFLDDVTWAMAHKGLSGSAREGLIRHAMRSEKPLDLRWLRELTELPDQMLEFMALDPATHWHEFMKVSTKPSDYLSSRVKKMLGPDDYARAVGKLRGVAGELVFVVERIELPGGLRIVGRQVQAGRRAIDFMLQDARGNKAMLEVKAWSRKTWERELPNLGSRAKLTPRSMAGRMIEQLEAALATGQSVYLAVPDAIGDLLPKLEDLLPKLGLRDVRVVTFPENKLKGIAARLRTGLALAAGVGLATADQIAEVYDE